MKISKVVKVIITAYLMTLLVPPVIGTTAKIIKYNVNKSEKIKEIKKDFELRRQGIITVSYQEIDD